ncbi:MAG TPA: polysaccharide biosynthesis tyrosine autokinase [Bacteroidales bacterium]|nr:polysaccharide biosynthesis tyrosine autokinase [Bacteroidales bacterium]
MTPQPPLTPPTQPTHLSPRLHRHQQDDIDLKRYMFLIMENWYWFIISVMAGVVFAYLVNKYTIKEYKVSATLLIESQSNQTNSFLSGNYQGNDMFSGFWLYPDMKMVENQMIVLQSYSQVNTTIHSVDFEVSYYKDEVTGRREIYTDAPFMVLFDSSKVQPLGALFLVTIRENGKLYLKAESQGEKTDEYDYIKEKITGSGPVIDYDKEITFGEELEGKSYSFRLQKREGKTLSEGTWYFRFNSYGDLVSEWRGRLALVPMKKEASILEISVNSDCPVKAKVFLDAHLNMYLQRTLDKKNQFANNTISFIDRQLMSISDSLGKKEQDLQDFRRNNEVVNLSFQAEQLFSQVRDLENTRAELKLQKDYFAYLKEYLKKNMEAGDLVAPAVMGVTDPLLNNLVLEMNRMGNEKVAMKGSEGNINPYIATVDSQIRNAKVTAGEILVNLQKNNEIAFADIDKRIEGVVAEVRKLPKTERELFSIERQFKLNDYIYTFMLQRRSEAQIAKASNSPDNEVIDYAMISGGPIKPKSNLNYIIGFLVGIVIPGLYFMLRETFNLKIETEDEVKRITSLPVAGHITHSTKEYYSIVLQDPQSNISEAFRNLRTRMKFFTREIKSPVILVTSSMPAEGKSFTALNLASAYSLAGSRTVLVSFDLRRPHIYKEFDLDNEKGITTYLIGRDSIEDIIMPSGYENLYIMPSGPIPPNPSELASSEKSAELFTELRNKFDFIIVDSAPIGAVSDTYSIAFMADATIILARHNKTLRQLLKDTIEDCKLNGISNISILMNDIRSDLRMYGYRGRYGYVYGYEYSYGSKLK